jgi:hypothetical protein
MNDEQEHNRAADFFVGLVVLGAGYATVLMGVRHLVW